MTESTFPSKLGDYSIVKTEDGHETLKSHYFDEACHSTSGAWEETKHNYFDGCEILEKYSNQENTHLTIFEVGFALGYGPLICFSELLKSEIQKPVIFVSSELDTDFIKWTLNESRLAEFLKERNAEIQDREKYVYVSFMHFKLYILKGDLRHSVNELRHLLNHPIDAIFHDPFSPRKNPKLWTKQWFLQIKKYCQRDVILSTYSSAVSFRKALIETGFHIRSTKGFGRKRTITQASLNEEFGDQEIMNEIKRSKAIAFNDLQIGE